MGGGAFSSSRLSGDYTPQNLGTLRLWNFANCKDGRFQTEGGRAEIAGREGKVFYYLRDRNEDCENWILVPKAADPNQSVNYWEIYDRRRRLKRLKRWLASAHAGTGRAPTAKPKPSGPSVSQRHGRRVM